MKQKLKKIAVGVVLAASLMYNALQAQTIEYFNGTIDRKASTQLSKKVGFFARSRGNFNLLDVSYKLGNGIDAVVEVQDDGEKTTPRIGMQYFTSKDGFSLYAIATTSDKKDVEVLTNLNFTEDIGKVKGIFNLETITDFDSYSLNRIRVGIAKDKYEVGIGRDFFNGKAGKTGVYVKIKF